MSESSALQYDSPRLVRNNFDLLRLILAGTVCLVHAYQLSGFTQLSWIPRVLSSEVAIKAFFVISGFLIFRSFERSKSFSSYLLKRIRRIYPAYFVVVTLFALGLYFASTKSFQEYFSFAWLKYIGVNIIFLNFLQPTLPGVFEANKFAAVNGALWTLKIEVMFYLSVPIFVFLFRRFSRLPVIIITYVVSVFYVSFMTLVAENTGSDLYNELGRQLPGQLSYFMAGAFFFYYLPLFEEYIGYFLSIAGLLLIVDRFSPLSLFEPFMLAVIVIFFGLFLYVGNFGKYGDFSYGTYILHFPTIQILVSSGWFKRFPGLFLISVVLLTTLGAVALWHLVEKRFLSRKSHYMTATTGIGLKKE